MSDLDATWARAWITACAEAMTAHREALNALDRAIGDGDHGQNMHRGFTAVVARLAEESTGEADGATGTVAAVLRVAASGLMSAVGGAAGPLYGTAFLRATKAADGTGLDAAGLARVLAAATEGITARGKAEPGDATMVDAWAPATEAAQEAVDAGRHPVAVLRAAAEAAAAGARATEPWVARKGRASYLGERARGHRDPGAQSSALLLAAAADTAAAQGAEGVRAADRGDDG